MKPCKHFITGEAVFLEEEDDGDDMGQERPGGDGVEVGDGGDGSDDERTGWRD